MLHVRINVHQHCCGRVPCRTAVDGTEQVGRSGASIALAGTVLGSSQNFHSDGHQKSMELDKKDFFEQMSGWWWCFLLWFFGHPSLAEIELIVK